MMIEAKKKEIERARAEAFEEYKSTVATLNYYRSILTQAMSDVKTISEYDSIMDFQEPDSKDGNT